MSDQASNNPNVQVSFNGLISTSVQLTILGSGPTTLSAVTDASAPARATGTINLGTFNTINPSGVTNATATRTTAGTRGAVLAAELTAILVYNGQPTGAISVARKNPAGALPDVPLANLRISSPSLPSWTSGALGTQVPNAGAAGYPICSGNCVSNNTYVHQLAVFVPDSQAAGSFTTVVVYTGVSP